jgi:putative ABC transport system permease protein
MSGFRVFLSRVSGAFVRRGDHRLREELETHAEMLANEYVRRGLTQTEARYAARRDLGNMTSIRQEYRQLRGLPLFENAWQDLKFSVRTLRRNRKFATSCVATLAVGLGSMITVLCVVSALLWKPLPYPDPQQLVTVKETDPRNGLWTFSEPDLLDLQQQSQSLSAIAAYQRDTRALTGSGEPEVLQCAAVTPPFFAMFGMKPVVGTTFSRPLPQVVISRELWRRKWQMDPRVIGRAMLLGSQTYSIVGVANAPRDLLPGVDALIPLNPKLTDSRSAHEIDVVARLRAGVSAGQAQAELSAIAGNIGKANPRTNSRWGMRIIPLADFIAGPNTNRTVWMIFAAVALLWILACVNVAGLQLARNVARRHEMSTRMALGAGRLRLLGQRLMESAVLAFAGGILGLLLSTWAVEAIRRLGGGAMPRLQHLQVDAVVMGIATACISISALIFGMLSGGGAAYQGARRISRRDHGRDALIVAQVALASVLLIAAGFLLQSFLRLRAVNPGFNPENVLSARVSLPADGQNYTRRVTFFQNAREQLERLPEIAAAAATNVMPFSGYSTANRFGVEGEPDSGAYHSAAWRAVTPGFFKALGIPLRRGRVFTNADKNGSLEVVIISESMARRFWPNQDPIGKRLLWGRSRNPKTIVGVVGDLRDLMMDQAPVPTMFRPFAQLSDPPMTLVIRTKTDVQAAIPDVRKVISTIDKDAALEFLPLEQVISESILRPRASLLVVATFALVAMMIAAFGLYGLISYRVNDEQQEIGIRLALGAQPGSVRWAVQKRCLMLVFIGAAAGFPSAVVLSRFMRALLYNTEPMELSAYAAVLVILAAVAFCASFGPALRASKMDPAAAIRHE